MTALHSCMHVRTRALAWNNKRMSRKTLLRVGRGLQVAGERALVTVDILRDYTTSDGDVKTLEKREGVEMRLGERVEPLDLLLDDAVAGMREGEVCRLAPIPHELTASTDAVPLGAELRYTVALLSLERGRQVWEMEGRELLCLARQDKERGTQLFKEQRERDAAASYSRAAKLAIAATGDEPDVPELLVTLYLNLAACQLKLRQNGHAFENSSRVLAVKPGCVKALYRRGVAAMSLGDLETAESDLTAAEKVEPGNRSVQSKLREVKRLLHIQTSSLSQALRPMFSPSS